MVQVQASEQEAIQCYHRAVYMPKDVLMDSLRALNRMQTINYSKHFIKRVNSHMSNRKFNNNDISLNKIKDADVVRVEVKKGSIYTVLIKYSLDDTLELYLCIALENTKGVIITGYTDRKNRKFNRSDLIKTGKYITK